VTADPGATSRDCALGHSRVSVARMKALRVLIGGFGFEALGERS
jgi:hypothetical protein